MIIWTLRFVLFGGLLAGPLLSTHAAEWTVPTAPIRFSYQLSTPPTHPQAGYLVQIPDGGLLPIPRPQAHVVAEDGSTVESYTLWHGAETGLWVVFADPGGGDYVDIYVKKSGQPKLWTPKTGLTPSPLLVTDPLGGSLSTAQKLARLGTVGKSVHIRTKAGIPAAPLSVGGDDTGRPRPSAFYLQAYVATTDPGKTWVAPVFSAGQNKVQIDGKPLNLKKRTDRWGGTGEWLDLEKGLHRVECFSASAGRDPYSNKFRGHAYIAWQTPKMPPTELGRKPTAKKKYSGTPPWAARIIKNREIVRSGTTDLVKATAQDGRPVALFRMTAGQNFWHQGEGQLAVYTFTALREGNPDDTTYTWTFERNARFTGPKVRWLIPGLQENQVTLTATSKKGRSSRTLPFFAYPTQQADLNSASDRKEFRYAMQTVLQGYPAQPDPCVHWPPSYWKNLMRTAEYGKGYPLLENLLGKRLQTATQKLPPADLHLLQKIFLDVVPRVDPEKALTWIKTFHRSAPTSTRAELNILEAEIRLIYLGQEKNAETLLRRVAQVGGESAERAKVRLGDIYLAQGELNKAVGIYANVQRKVRHQRQGANQPGQQAVDSWKLGAIKDAEHSKQVAMLVDTGEYLSARETLDHWERNFPLSKISEDFILQEARLYKKLGDLKRARWLLEPYCMTVDASNYLPDAAVTLLEIMEFMGEKKAVISDTAVALKKRLKFHPAAEAIDFWVEGDDAK